jgi:Domain of unknown function (4846)
MDVALSRNYTAAVSRSLFPFQSRLPGLLAVVCVSLAAAAMAQSPKSSSAYSWMAEYHATESIASRIAVPAGFERVPVDDGSFADWLRRLPLRKGRPGVLLFDGRSKPRQDVHVAVLDIDTGNRDLQQCADAVIRLRAEYLYSRHENAAIHFNFTSGATANYSAWSEGFRPVVRGQQVTWEKSARPDASYNSFRAYLNTVFTYAGTASLNKELQRVEEVRDLRIGDVFIQPGYPGHAVIVVDIAQNPRTGNKAFLLAQSYTPAQDIHILTNPGDLALAPWYDINIGSELRTPEWTFARQNLRRFPEVVR